MTPPQPAAPRGLSTDAAKVPTAGERYAGYSHDPYPRDGEDRQADWEDHPQGHGDHLGEEAQQGGLNLRL